MGTRMPEPPPPHKLLPMYAPFQYLAVHTSPSPEPYFTPAHQRCHIFRGLRSYTITHRSNFHQRRQFHSQTPANIRGVPVMLRTITVSGELIPPTDHDQQKPGWSPNTADQELNGARAFSGESRLVTARIGAEGCGPAVAVALRRSLETT